MQEIIKVNYEEKPCYEIIINDSFLQLSKCIKNLGYSKRRIAIITDSNVNPLYGMQIKNLLSEVSDNIIIHEFSAGENYKNLETVYGIYEDLIKHHFDRKDLLIALGGGVVGDITGFCASTYLRGIGFIQIPTTLLAQTDSSVGGKTGVDYKGYKNMVGAFYMPKLVYININVLKTLDARQFASGFAEVMKYGLIMDNDFYTWLIDNIYEINDRDSQAIAYLIMKSCEFKKKIVEQDPKEQGIRAILNFGHTIGHAIEKYKDFKLLHGECVALGCVAAAIISNKKGLIDTDTCYEIRDMFVPFGLPITVDDIDIDKIYELMKSDKKADSGKIRFILLKDLGNAYVDSTVTEKEIKDALNELCLDEAE